MKLINVIKNIDVEILGNKELEIYGIENDSRKINKGDIYIAIDGWNTKGINFLHSAIEKGAVCCMLDEKYIPNIEEYIKKDEIYRNITYIFSKNVLEDLAIFSRDFYEDPSKDMIIIGITGTKGKTTVATVITKILEKKANVLSIGTNGAFINDEKIYYTGRTTLESFENQRLFKEAKKRNVKYVVMEISSQAMIKARVEGINFRRTSFTNFSEDHIGPFEHPDLESYFKAKIEALNTSNFNIINIDDENVKRSLDILKENTFITIGKDKRANIFFNENSIKRNEKTEVEIEIKKGPYEEKYIGKYLLKNNIPGIYSIYNSLIVIANLISLNIPMEDILDGLKKAFVKGRMEKQENDLGLNIYIDFAHTPDSIENLLKTARDMTKGKVYAIWGADGDRDKRKRPIMGQIVEKYADYNLITPLDFFGPEKYESVLKDILDGLKNREDEKNMPFDSRIDAIKYAIKNMKKEDILLVIGKNDDGITFVNGKKEELYERKLIKAEIEKRKNKE